jgi:hypothetical protein
MRTCGIRGSWSLLNHSSIPRIRTVRCLLPLQDYLVLLYLKLPNSISRMCALFFPPLVNSSMEPLTTIKWGVHTAVSSSRKPALLQTWSSLADNNWLCQIQGEHKFSAVHTNHSFPFWMPRSFNTGLLPSPLIQSASLSPPATTWRKELLHFRPLATVSIQNSYLIPGVSLPQLICVTHFSGVFTATRSSP